MSKNKNRHRQNVQQHVTDTKVGDIEQHVATQEGNLQPANEDANEERKKVFYPFDEENKPKHAASFSDMLKQRKADRKERALKFKRNGQTED